MQTYSYTVKDEKNETLKGQVEARNEKAAVEALRSRGYVVVSLKSLVKGQVFGQLDSIVNRVKKADVMAMTQQLATMINAGLPLTEALELMRVQMKPQFSQIITKILRDVQGGTSLADAMAKHPETFSAVYISLVRAGEASGKLDEILNRLAETEEKAEDFRRKTKGALIYPIIVVLAMIGVGVVMMMFVVPQLTSMYDDLGAELPLVTQVLIGISDLMKALWWVVLPAMFVGGLLLRSWIKTSQGKEQFDRLILKVPVLGSLRVQVMMADFSRTLALLASSGISILEALDIVSRSMENVVFQKAITQAAKGLEKGNPLAAMLAKQHIFPPLMTQMISVGEETGELDTVLTKVSRYFEAEAEAKIKNLTTAIEPVIMVVLGIGVAFIVIAIIMPLYQLTEQF